MCDQCSSGEALIDAAITEGRVDLESRETLIRSYELAPDLVVSTLAAAKPDEGRASRNYTASLSEAEDAAYRAHASRMLFIEPSEVL